MFPQEWFHAHEEPTHGGHSRKSLAFEVHAGKALQVDPLPRGVLIKLCQSRILGGWRDRGVSPVGHRPLIFHVLNISCVLFLAPKSPLFPVPSTEELLKT